MNVQMITKALGGARGCGAGRTEGHIYIECGFSTAGQPVEQFLTDLPLSINTAQLGYCAQGITLLEQGGVYHVVDIVGAQHYPNVSDFVEEARVMGVSRKIPRTAEFEKLTRQSTLILIHPRGYVENAAELAPHVSGFSCPCGKNHSADEPCVGWHWHLAEANTQAGVLRRIPSGTYPVKGIQPGRPEPVLSEGVFMQVPISNLTVINNKQGQTDPTSLGIARRAALPVFTSNF